MDFATLKPLFAKSKVQSALVIDDAFDPGPDYDNDDLQRTFQMIEQDDQLEQAFVALGGNWPTNQVEFSHKIRTDNSIQTQLRGALHAVENLEDPTRKLARSIFGHSQQAHFDKRRPLDALRSVLSEVGIEPTEIGATGKADKKYPLVFLDYYLGDDNLPSVQRSIEKIKDVLKDYTNDEMPIVVLMSSALNDLELAEAFRGQADLLGCQFKFVTKDKFMGAAFEFVSSLADRAEHLGQARTLSGFVKGWRSSLENAISEFADEIKSLDLQDFYFIWKKAGEGKNGRFGDHMSLMLDGFLRKQIEDKSELMQATRKLNELSFPSMPPSPMIPSATVARLAHAAAFKDLEPFPKDHSGLLGVDLGDLFISEKIEGTGKNRKTVHSAMIVISQACDLEHGKVGTILLVEGDLQKRSASTRPLTEHRERILRVDLFQYRNERDEVEDYIVEWDAQKLRTYAISTFHEKSQREGYQRVARLRPVHALAMQQKFAAQLTRVGMPDSMPVYHYSHLAVHFAAKNGNGFKKLVSFDKDERLACVVGETEATCVITDPGLEKIRAAIQKADPEEFAPGSIEKVRNELNDVTKLRRLRSVALEKGKKVLGPIAVSYSDKPFALDTAVSGKVVMVLSVHMGHP